MTVVMCIVLGVIGSLLAEGAKQLQKFRAMSEDKFKAQLVSLKFYVSVLFLIVCGATATWVLHYDSSGNLSAGSCLAAGAGAVAFFRQLGSAVTPDQPSGQHFARGKQRVTFRDVWS